MRSRKYAPNARRAAAPRSTIPVPAGMTRASRLRATSRDQPLKASRSSAGTPSISQITITGSG
jgi:hypothetical protein